MNNNDTCLWDTQDGEEQKDKKQEEFCKGFYMELPVQGVYLDKTGEKSVLQCQLSPCKQEDALKEAFVLKLDKKTNSVRIKNVSVEGLKVKLYLLSSSDWGLPERSVNCVIGEEIICEGPVTAIKTKQGLKFKSIETQNLKLISKDNQDKSIWNISPIIKTLRIGETAELQESDEIIIRDQPALILRQRRLLGNTQGGTPFGSWEEVW